MSVHDGNDDRRSRGLQYSHGKPSAEDDAGSIPSYEVATEAATTTAAATTTTTTTVTTTEATATTTSEASTTQATTVSTSEEEAQAVYESQFDWLPVSPQTGTSTALFSNPNRFSINGIHNTRHYLTNKLEGRAWLDVNGDGRRGDYSNSTVNAMENDVGIGNVDVQLVNCETDEFVSSSVTEPIEQGGPEEVKISEDESGGMFSFNIDAVEPGRYYLVYKAPTGYRLSGNVLPLERGAPPNDDCVPSGGEGLSYVRQARENGDLDIGGYCARSIGCMELASGPYPSVFESNFDPYADISVIQDEIIDTGIEKEYNSHQGNLIAMPSASYLNVGLARENWPLPAYQYAEGQITLTVPSSISVEAAVPEDFERSAVRTDLEDVLTAFLEKSSGSTVFALQGVDLQGAKIVDVIRDDDDVIRDDDEARSRMLRGSRQLSPEVIPSGNQQQQQLEYTFTSRGHYRPPPFQQLGEIVQDSINRDPEQLVKSLKDKESLPQAFSEVQDIEARHLTVKVSSPKKPQAWTVTSAENGSTMDSWAVISVTLLASVIIILFGLFVYRRAFHQRVKKASSSEGKICSVKTDRSMSILLIKEELESYGVSADGLLEKSELLDALEHAQTQKEEHAQKEKKSKKKRRKRRSTKTPAEGTNSTTPSPGRKSSSIASSSSTAHVDESTADGAADREARIQLAALDCETLKVGELREMLDSLGVSTEGFVEKSEFVQALAEARVDGVNRKQA